MTAAVTTAPAGVAQASCGTVPCGPALRLSGVSLRLGGSTILEDVNWEVHSGEIHAIVGPNGCGKSTLIKTVLGMMAHTGSVQLHWPGPQFGRLSYVPQAIECDRTLPMTVLDFMAAMLQRRPLFLGAGRAVRKSVEQALERVGMAQKMQRRMGELSGGERQRVLLAQSLLPPTQFVLLDEPMAALDQAGMAVFEALLADWRSRGVTVLWVEHDLMAVRRLADRVTALRRGRIQWTRTPAALADAAMLLELFAHGTVHAPVRTASSHTSEVTV